MINGTGGGHPPDGDGADDAPDMLAEADDGSLLALGSSVLAELKDRGMLRIALRNRTDAATVFEAEQVRIAGENLEIVAEGYHAETPDHYEIWVREADALHEGLSRPGLSEAEAEALLGTASDEALLLELDRAQETEAAETSAAGEDQEEAEDGIGARIAIELLRRGVIEDMDEP